MKDTELRQLLDNLPINTKITPKYSVLCKELCFTPDKFTTGCKWLDSAIYKLDKNVLGIIEISTTNEQEHTGYFRKMMKNLQRTNYDICFYGVSSNRLKNILQKIGFAKQIDKKNNNFFDFSNNKSCIDKYQYFKLQLIFKQLQCYLNGGEMKDFF